MSGGEFWAWFYEARRPLAIRRRRVDRRAGQRPLEHEVKRSDGCACVRVCCVKGVGEIRFGFAFAWCCFALARVVCCVLCVVCCVCLLLWW